MSPGEPADASNASQKGRDNIPQLLEALRTRAGLVVSVADLARAAGYSETTLRTYLTKNKLAPYVCLAAHRSCQIGDVSPLSLGVLRRRLTQRDNRFAFEHLGVTELVSDLLERSRTNAGLALELFNRPELENRLDAFLLLFVTAWEQLLKAEVESERRGAIFTGERSAAGRPATIGLAKAIELTMPESKAAARRNLEVLKDLRDGAAHLLVPEVTGIASRYFQAGLINYMERFQRFAQEPPFRFSGTGLLTLAVPYVGHTVEALRASHGSAAEDIGELIRSLENQATAGDPQFVVSLKHELILEKRPGPGSVRLVAGGEGTPISVVKVPRDVNKDWPHNAGACARRLGERTGIRWSANDVGLVAAYLGVKDGDNEFHYGIRYGRTVYHTYSDAFVERVVQRHQQTPGLIQAARTAKKTRAEQKEPRNGSLSRSNDAAI